MELFHEILIEALSKERTEIFFPELTFHMNELIESRCYQALIMIKNILAEESFSDKECFLKIEEIVKTFEKIGSSGGSRHDF